MDQVVEMRPERVLQESPGSRRSFEVEHGAIDETPLLATLPPSDRQRRIAFAIVGFFVGAFLITLPFANTPLQRLDAWIPAFTSALVITDLITSALLFSQFSIARRRALLVLATGYVFSALMVIPYALTFPGVFAPTGLLGADLQSAVWLYIFWHVASPLSIVVYQLFRDDRRAPLSNQPLGNQIVLSIAIVVAMACGLTWLVTAQHDLLPRLYHDSTHLSPTVQLASACVVVSCVLALALLWIRGSSVLDLWLMVTVSAWLLEIILQGVFLTDRFSLAWYVGRTYSLIAGSVVLIMLLSEATTLYAHLARTAMRQRAARSAREIAMETMAASIAHEVNQPLGSIALNAHAALSYLARTPLDEAEVRAAIEDIAAASSRGSQIIAGLRAMFNRTTRGRTSVDAADLVREVLAILDLGLRAQRVLVSTALQAGLPRIMGDRGQLEQVLLNVITNAMESMRPVSDRECSLRISSDFIEATSEIRISIADSGPGIDRQDEKHIFEPFFSTKPAGMGIGLTICQSIVVSHGGSLRALANKPYGTIFEIVLPTDPEHSAGESV
jgi:signal transduction histidine kinase